VSAQFGNISNGGYLLPPRKKKAPQVFEVIHSRRRRRRTHRRVSISPIQLLPLTPLIPINQLPQPDILQLLKTELEKTKAENIELKGILERNLRDSINAPIKKILRKRPLFKKPKKSSHLKNVSFKAVTAVLGILQQKRRKRYSTKIKSTSFKYYQLLSTLKTKHNPCKNPLCRHVYTKQIQGELQCRYHSERMVLSVVISKHQHLNEFGRDMAL